MLDIGLTTGAVTTIKPEATAIGDLQDGRWKITFMFDGCRFCTPKFRSSTLQQTTRQWRHWWFLTTSCFNVTNHSESASLWLVRQDWATINSGGPPSCGTPFWQWSEASPSEMFGWLVRYLDIYLFYVYGPDQCSFASKLDCAGVVFADAGVWSEHVGSAWWEAPARAAAGGHPVTPAAEICSSATHWVTAAHRSSISRWPTVEYHCHSIQNPRWNLGFSEFTCHWNLGL